MTDVVIVVTTVADDEDAEELARLLVDERLAACVNLHQPMLSFYMWKGKVERDTERQMVIKTTRERLPALQARLLQLHGYELPEFLVLASEASADYLSWVNEIVSPARNQP